MSKISRAETAQDKIAKGEFILSTAERMIQRDGLDQFSMNRLCAECDVGKGTLYLYFRTKSEIISALYCEKLGLWSQRLATTCSVKQEYPAFCQIYLDTMLADPLLVTLLPTGPMLQRDALPHATYVEIIKALTTALATQADIFANTLNIGPAKASQLVWGFYTATLGASAYYNAPEIQNALPDDVAQIQSALRFDRLFLSTVASMA